VPLSCAGSENKFHEHDHRRLGIFSATSIVVASMVGTGIFTTTGFLASELNSPFLILLAWALSGLTAICGALSYAELAAAMPQSGGEYHYLSITYHRSVGFLSAWVSLIVGFSAPIAAASVACGKYLSSVFPSTNVTLIALSLVIFISLLHSVDIRIGSYAQNIFTFGKVIFIVALIAAGFIFGSGTMPSFAPAPEELRLIISPDFAVSLIFISFAYSGWNAATYIGGEIKEPHKNLPRALLFGTVIVTVLYLGLNCLYLYALPLKDMADIVEIGSLAAIRLFGDKGGAILSLFIAFALVSSVSAMVMAGPRVYEAMGRDIHFFRILSRQTSKGVPVYAIMLQMSITLVFILTTVFESLLFFIGFTINLFSWLTVCGLYVYRFQKNNRSRYYRTWGYPVVPGLFLLSTGWSIVHIIRQRPTESLAGLLVLLAGLVIYYIKEVRKILT
jgi:APA family basic amino acid/polyamine antiporter